MRAFLLRESVYYHDNGQKVQRLACEGKDHGSGAAGTVQDRSNESIYKDGKLLTEIGWQPNGERCPFTNVLNGSGTLVLWHENGQKRSEESFKDGDECGLKIFGMRIV